jgi:hypothetical protein
LIEDEPKELVMPKKLPMESLQITTTEQRLGPILSEFTKGLETAGEYERFIVVAEGFGEEDQPTPSDLGDETPTPPLPGKIRAAKSMIELRKSDWALVKSHVKKGNSSKKPAKVIRKIVKKKVTFSPITTDDISSPIPQSPAEWEQTRTANISKEYTRKSLIVQEQARRHTLLTKPEASTPVVKSAPQMKRLQQRPFPKRLTALREGVRAFEEPRETPKPPQMPYRKMKEDGFDSLTVSKRPEPLPRSVLLDMSNGARN